MDWNKKFFDLSLEQKMEVSKGILYSPLSGDDASRKKECLLTQSS